MKKQTKKMPPIIDIYVMLVTLAAFTIFYIILYIFNIRTDIQPHVTSIISMLNGDIPIAGNFLYYLIVYLFAFCQKNYSYLLASATFVLTLAVTLKFTVTRSIIYQFFPDNNYFTKPMLNLICILLLFAFNLYIPGLTMHFYAGQFPPNVWHNSTVIFLMPFALLLFWQSYKYMEESSHSKLYLIALLALINIFIKPSFFFCFAIIFPVFMLFKYKFKKAFWISIIPVVVGGLLLVIQYSLIYLVSQDTQKPSGIKIDFLNVWTIYTKNIFASIGLSIFFPVVFLVFYLNKVRSNYLILYAWSLLIIGFIIFAFISETGHRQFHANFGWQNVVCNYILFLSTLMIFIEIVKKKPKLELKDKLIAASFLIHVATGLYYIIRIINKGYYL